MRLLILLHRYLGIAVGLMIAAWCLSGVVMMYVRYPELDHRQRLQALAPLDLRDCCNLEAVGRELGVNVFRDFSVETLAGNPVLVAAQQGGPRMVFDLRSGRRLQEIDSSQAMRTAARHAHSLGIAAQPAYLGTIERDQWTVSGAFNGERPLHWFSLADLDNTQIYVSSRTGRVIQHTTGTQRFWNRCGTVVHWLYPTVLRQNARLWSQVVIWLSIVGVFLTAIGLYIGVVQWRAVKQRWSPYRGAHRWHHIAGLVFGVFTLTWLASGLVSMNPWGFLAGNGARAEQERLTGIWIDGQNIVNSIGGLAKQAGVTRIESVPFDGRLYLLLYRGSQTLRVDANFSASGVGAADVDRAAALLADGADFQTDLLAEGDRYYYSGHERRSFPVYRVSLNDTERTRYYLDERLQLIDKVDAARRWYRWLFEGLHRLDFNAFFRQRPWWDALTLTLLGGVTAGAFTGVYIGYRRLTRQNSL
jgi:hypothetical protein